jgi:hypothetical protein
VAICEQVEEPGSGPGIVRREVTRVITPGMVLDEEALEPRASNFLAAVHGGAGGWGGGAAGGVHGRVLHRGGAESAGIGGGAGAGGAARAAGAGGAARVPGDGVAGVPAAAGAGGDGAGEGGLRAGAGRRSTCGATSRCSRWRPSGCRRLPGPRGRRARRCATSRTRRRRRRRTWTGSAARSGAATCSWTRPPGPTWRCCAR